MDTLADIRGLFFDVENSEVLMSLSVQGTDVRSFMVSENGVTNLGKGTNLKPAEGFDIGVEIGSPGMGKDDIALTEFQLIASAPIYLGDRFGLRLTSVGEYREGSSKLLGAPIPLPATILLLGSGLVSLGLLGRRKK